MQQFQRKDSEEHSRDDPAHWILRVCVVNAYTSNHDVIAANETGAFKGFVLHAVDAIGIVHAMLLRIQVLMLPIKTR